MVKNLTVGGEKLQLEQAFAHFNQVSNELVGAYQLLEEQVAVLNGKLAAANDELLRQAQRNQALAGRLSLLLESLPAGVVETGPDGVVVAANPAARQMLPGLLPGACWHELLQSLEPTRVEDTYRVPAGYPGGRIQVQQCVLEGGGAPILLLHDVSHLHQLHEALTQQEKLASMGRMAASLAHQLRTPLATAMLYAANVQRPELAEDDRRRFAGKIVDRLRALEGLVQNMLGFVRTPTQCELLDAASLFAELEAIIRPQCEHKAVVLACRLPPLAPVPVFAERKSLLSSWIALAENALAHTPSGGQIRFELRADAQQLCLLVADSGEGVADEIRDRIFEPFFSGRVGGTGLGLAIVKKVADEMSGEVRVSRSEWGGACFEMCLPYTAAQGVFPA